MAVASLKTLGARFYKNCGSYSDERIQGFGSDCDRRSLGDGDVASVRGSQGSPRPNHGVDLLAVGLLTLLHLGIAGAWWKLPDGLAGGILSAFFIVALAFGIYEHFLHPGGNNIFMVSPSKWKTAFEVSVGLLMALEVLGVGIGIRSLNAAAPVGGVRVAV
jgi:hypothetical protein